MNKRSYWQQKASPWVSAAVLAGGLATAIILVFLVRLETQLQNFSPQFEEVVESSDIGN